MAVITQSPADTPVRVVPLTLHTVDGETVKVTDPLPAPPEVASDRELPTLTLCCAAMLSVG